MEKKIHYVDWKEVRSLEGKLFETGFHHEIRVIRETIPIIFVPGIMGTNLQGSKGLAWFPSNPGWMKDNHAHATPKDRKSRLIDDKRLDVLRFGQVPSADDFFLKAARESIFNGKEPFFDWLPIRSWGTFKLPPTKTGRLSPQNRWPRWAGVKSPPTPTWTTSSG